MASSERRFGYCVSCRFHGSSLLKCFVCLVVLVFLLMVCCSCLDCLPAWLALEIAFCNCVPCTCLFSFVSRRERTSTDVCPFNTHTIGGVFVII